MKNHIIFKFIAVILCATSLMGAVGGIAGVVVLTESDLYNKTVDQVIDQQIQNYAENYADRVALVYSGRELGGCPDRMLDRYDDGDWFPLAFPNFGYSILDEDGNVLAGYNEELKDSTEVYTIPVTGQYMHLVSAEPVVKEVTAAASQDGSEPTFILGSDLITQSQIEVYSMDAFFADGSSVRYDDGGKPVGLIIYYDGEYAVFESFEGQGYSSDMMTKTVTDFICCDAEDTVIFQMSSPNGVGDFTVNNSGCIFFTSVTVDELMTGGPRYAEGMLTDADGKMVPENGIAVNQVTFTRADGRVMYEAFCHGGDGSYTFYHDGGSGSAGGISASSTGFLFYNQAGQLVYHSTLSEGEMPASSLVYGVNFYNIDSGFTFQVDDPDGLGTLSLDNGSLVFTSYAIAAKEETETAEETVPETVPEETVTETVAETAPQETAEVTAPVETAPVTAEETWTDEMVPAAAAVEETIPSSASAIPEEVNTEAVAEPVQETEAVTESVPEETIPAETIPEETVPATIPEETIPEVTEPVMINGKRLEDYQINRTEYYDSETGEQMTAQYVYITMPKLTVEMYVDRDTMRDAAVYDVLRVVRQYRNYLMPLIAICLFLFAVFAVYLCTAAGRKPKTEEVHAGGLNRIPLDLYLFGGGFGAACIIAVGVEIGYELLRQNILVGCSFAVAATFLVCLIFVGFCFAFVAQIKTPGGFWWRNSLCGYCIRGVMKFAVWLENFLSTKGVPFLGRSVKKLWQFICTGAVWLYKSAEKALLWLGGKLSIGFHWIRRKIGRWLSLMPLTWQWLTVGFFLIIVLMIGVDGFKDGSDMSLPVAFILTMAVVMYVSHCFGILSESTKRMSKGDLDTKVDDKLMAGCFKEFASDLNDLADVAVVAAQKQLKSERMKTELITNVSHDIKTPLTSIINYVDLLQKPHTDEEEEQYLEVLDRQSQRLKKLIDDLMDLSKASTGNMAVEITKVDAIESVNQALGEFADKLDRAQLTPVFRHDEERVSILADGRLVWRVMSNLLSNAVKYAMPGTRLYIDLMELEGKVVISMKNISREELNVDAEELMERFVRGDDSRNTEGSGLGLNIAKSLMELQKGQLQLLVDGDLFKVTLIFPGVGNAG